MIVEIAAVMTSVGVDSGNKDRGSRMIAIICGGGGNDAVHKTTMALSTW